MKNVLVGPFLVLLLSPVWAQAASPMGVVGFSLVPFLLSMGILGVFVFLFWWVAKVYDPPGKLSPEEGEGGIEPILYLPLLGMGLTFYYSASAFFEVGGLLTEVLVGRLFSGRSWGGSGWTDAYFVALAFVNGAILVFVPGFLTLFFQRRTSVPRLAVGYYVFVVVWVLIRQLAVDELRSEGFWVAGPRFWGWFRAIFGLVVWGSLFLFSRQAEGAFVVRADGKLREGDSPFRDF